MSLSCNLRGNTFEEFCKAAVQGFKAENTDLVAEKDCLDPKTAFML